MEKTELWHSAGATVTVRHCGNLEGAPKENLKSTPLRSNISFLGIHYTEMKSSHHKDIYLHSEVIGQYLQKLRYENNHNIHQGWVGKKL